MRPSKHDNVILVSIKYREIRPLLGNFCFSKEIMFQRLVGEVVSEKKY
jgi:hypothetical protein